MKKWIIKAVSWVALISAGELFSLEGPVAQNHLAHTSCMVSDSGRIYKAHVDQYVRPESEEELQKIFEQARREGKKISFSGQRFSQGGQTFNEGGIVVDMRSLNRIVKIDPIAKTAVVQGGATWEEVQDAINPYGLAIKVMQASNIFSVGGSLSVNAHGRDARYGTLIHTVRSIKVMKADGEVVLASRTQNNDLFRAVIGGYGLFGAILEAEIELTSNVIYRKTAEVVNIEEYPVYFQSQILGKKDIGLHFARLNLSSNSYLKDVIAVSFVEDEVAQCKMDLKPENHILKNKAQLFLLRHFDVIKALRWPVEVKHETKGKVTTRNQAMRPPVKCLSYCSKLNTDILQEYFIPVNQFISFTDALRKISKKEKINLLNVTIRYVPKDTSSLVPYAKEDSFAFVIYVTQGRSQKQQVQAKKWTRLLIDAALECGGRYYLPYQLYATEEQFHQTYPEFKTLLERKKIHDPQSIFSNKFYETYSSSKRGQKKID